jgi:two-component system chemotaxis sensor kinase CheA
MGVALLDSVVEELAAAVVMTEANDRKSVDTVRRCLAKLREVVRSDCASEDLIALADACIALETRLKASETETDAEALAALSDAVGRLQSCAAATAKSNRQASAVSPERVTRDEDTVGLIGEFLSESEEGLGRADQILMNVEPGGASAEAVNGLFRVFHTVKGVAGFLELNEITRLAHTTEDMLGRCRDGMLKLADERLDVVFDATAMVRRMLAELRAAVQDSAPFATLENLEELLQRLRALTEDAPPAVAAAPADTNPLEPAASVSSTSHGPQAAGTTKLRETVKVDLERVDNLVAMVGELVMVEAMVGNAPEIAKSASARVRNCLSQLAKVTRDLQDVGMRMRMVPVAGVFQKNGAHVARPGSQEWQAIAPGPVRRDHRDGSQLGRANRRSAGAHDPQRRGPRTGAARGPA